MSNISKLQAIVNGFNFKKGDYVGAEDQLSRFAEIYAQLSLEEAELLRGEFDSKDRLGWLRIASTLFVKGFADADSMEKEKLCRIFFALYSFENLEFGFDGVMDVISVSDQMKGHAGMAKRNWKQFSELTSNDAAKNNLENKVW
jgi:hypothetical protein